MTPAPPAHFPRICVALLAIACATGARAQLEAPAIPGPPPSKGCAPDVPCPPQAIRGTVVVDSTFDGLGTSRRNDGFLTSDEIQCAVDCLDLDPEPERVLPDKLVANGVPPFVPGGTVLFVPESPPAGYIKTGERPVLRYLIDTPIELPYTSGTLALQGNGALLRLAAPAGPGARTIFRRTVPKSASPRDVEFLGSWAMGWQFQGLTFIDPKPGSRRAPSTAIELHGVSHVVIDRCRFEGLDRGVELHFCHVPVIRDCTFAGCREHDIIVADGTFCGPERGPCWTGTEGWQRASGSDHPLMSHNFHATASSAEASVRIVNTIFPVIDSPTFEAARPKNSVIVQWRGLATEVTIRDAYVEFGEAPRGDAIFRFEHGGVARIDGLTYIGPYPHDTLIDTSAAQNVRVTLEHCGQLPAGVDFANGSNASMNAWTFREVQAFGTALDDPSRWRGGRAAIPKRLAIQGGWSPSADAGK